MLAGLKALLEHGVKLDVVKDRFPSVPTTLFRIDQ
jgi:hypothetical protein